MKRKIFSAVLALVMLLTLAPMAFATEETDEPVVILPDGTKVVGIPTIDEPKERSAEQTVYTINTIEDLKPLVTQENRAIWVNDNIFEITGNLDLSSLYSDSAASYTGLIEFFYGTIRGIANDKGEYPVISGIPSRMGLIRYPIGGIIENLTFDHGTRTPYITVLAGSFGSGREIEPLTFNDITVVGDSNVPTLVPSNYSPFVYTCPSSGIIMNNCVNKIKMYGTAYSSIFFGYYPAYVNGGVNVADKMRIEFNNCVNEGSLTTNRAGMFFGNSTGLENYIGKVKLVIKGCVNNGTIFGFDNAYYLCAAAANEGEFTGDTVSAKIESVLVNGKDSPYASDYPNIEQIEGEPENIGKVTSLSGFTAKWKSDNTITFEPATSGSKVTKYTVNVGAYVHTWETENNRFYGTTLYTVSEDFTPEEIGDKTEVTADLMAYGFANSGYGMPGGTLDKYDLREGRDGSKYYEIKNNSESAYQYFASGELGENNQPLNNGAVPPYVVIVTAYGENNSILQTYWITTPEAQQ